MQSIFKIFMAVLISSLFTLASASVHSFGVFGDAGQFGNKLGPLKESLLSQGINNLIITGDTVPNIGPSHQSIWGDWKGQFNFEAVTIGNHNQGVMADVNFFDLPGEYYSKLSDNLRIIVLSSSTKNTALIEAQKTFLLHELSVASEKFIFIVFHQSPVTLTDFHRWEEKDEFHLAIFPVIQKFKDKVSMLFVGHDHIATLVDVGGIPLVVASSSIDNTRVPQKINYIDSRRNIPVKSIWTAKGGHYWLELDVDTLNSQMQLRFFDLDKNQTTCSIVIEQHRAKLANDCVSSGL